MHYEVAEFQKPSTSAAFFEAIDKCQVVPMKELPQVTCSNTGKAFLNSQMSFKITVNNSSDSTEPQQSPHEMSVPLLDLIPKRPSIFERLPILQRTQEFRCPKSSKEYFQQQKHQSMKDNVNQTLSADGLHRVLDTFQENLETSILFNFLEQPLLSFGKHTGDGHISWVCSLG